MAQSYYVAKFLCDVPLRVGQGLLFGCAQPLVPCCAELNQLNQLDQLLHNQLRLQGEAPVDSPAQAFNTLLAPQASIPSLPLCSAILYWIVGLNPSASAFFIFCCIVICEGLAAQGLGVALSAGGADWLAGWLYTCLNRTLQVLGTWRLMAFNMDRSAACV